MTEQRERSIHELYEDDPERAERLTALSQGLLYLVPGRW